jgi:hypothetical protein
MKIWKEYSSVEHLVADEARFDAMRKEKMCVGKVPYDKRGAQTQINFFNRTRRGRHGNCEALRMYSCPYCGQWHLTSAEL